MHILLRIAAFLGTEAALVLVGGGVRDWLLGRQGAGDWDLATALHPEEVMRRAKQAGYSVIPTGLRHGTVTVLVDGQAVEITTFRSDGPYLDGRHPDNIRLGVSLEEDLARRDFTINAMAIPVGLLADERLASLMTPEDRAGSETPDREWIRGRLVDPYGGQGDLRRRLIRAVGDPLLRFEEDGLRPLRACRFASQLDFEIEEGTMEAISRRLEVSAKVSVERVMTEMTKLLVGQNPARGLRLLERSGLMDLWMPELRAMLGCSQNRYHDLDVWEHTLKAIESSPRDAGMRWALLLHDSGKPATKTGIGLDCHFFGHEEHSARIAEAVLRRLKASNALLEKALGLILRHRESLDLSSSDRACRRLLKRLADSKVSVEDWLLFRAADFSGKRVGEACAGRDNYLLQNRLLAMADSKPPLKTTDLALNGRELMAIANRKGGPWLGELQAKLLDAVVEDPALNTPDGLKTLASTLLGQ